MRRLSPAENHIAQRASLYLHPAHITELLRSDSGQKDCQVGLPHPSLSSHERSNRWGKGSENGDRWLPSGQR